MLETVPSECDVTSQSCLWVVPLLIPSKGTAFALPRMLVTAGCTEKSPCSIVAGWWPRTHWQGSQQHPLAEAMDLTSLSEFWTLSGCIFLLFFFYLYIVVILKHFSLCFVYFICYRLISGDLHLIRQGVGFFLKRGGWGWHWNSKSQKKAHFRKKNN